MPTLSRSTKRLAKGLLARLGYEIRELPRSLDSAAALTVKEGEYYTRWSPPCPLFAPWSGHPDFQQAYEKIAPHTVVSADRCYILLALARYAVHLTGDFAECGVYKGGTALLLCRALTGTGKMLHLFDSFQGLPAPNPRYDTHYREGTFGNVSIEAVRALLHEFALFVDMRPGWIPTTFAGLEDKRYAFVHIDVDLHQSNLDCCEYFYPRLVKGGVILFDEYGFPSTRGEKDAVDHFFADKPESPITLPTGQAVVLKV